MANRYEQIPESEWGYAPRTAKLLAIDLKSVEADVAALKAGGVVNSGGSTTDASQLTTGTLAPARLVSSVPLVSTSPTTRPTNDAAVTVLFFTATQPTVALTNDRWFQS